MVTLGQFFVFEGADAVGKTTLSKAIAAELITAGRQCQWYAFPGREEGTIGSLVYRLHHEPTAFNVKGLTASSLQTLHIAAHLDAIESVILPILRRGGTLILDRFWWSTWVYGTAHRINPRLLRSLIDAERFAWGEFLPSAAFFVTRNQPFGDEEKDRWSALNTGYRELVKSEEQFYPVHVIENQGTIEDATRRVLAILR
jgi:dTMP kinase